MSRRLPNVVALAAALAAFTVVVLRCAWMCDDAFITLRTVDNLMGGYGLTWNVAERVQAYTHPLWMLLLVPFYALTREPFFTPIFLGLILSVLTASILAGKVARGMAAGLAAVAILSVSKAFVDYATSGLENPLVHLLLVLFIVVLVGERAGQRRLFLLSLAAGLCMVARLDTALLVLPALAWETVRTRGSRGARAGAVLAGLAPLLLWEVFSLVYYGFPFPNTAYAKLNTGISKPLLWKQGAQYLKNSLLWDPVTLAVISCALAVTMARNRRRWPLAAGILLYIAYIVWIGGGFMSGRLLTAPLVVAVALLARHRLDGAPRWVPVAIVIVIAGIVLPRSPWRSGTDYGSERDNLVDAAGIADERGYYFQDFGLRRNDGRGVEYYIEAIKGREAAERGTPLVMGGNIGVFGYYAGPDVYVLDGFALADPLLARLPVRSTNWRIGHFVREVPAGYVESLSTGDNVIEDEAVHAYYQAIRTVTRGRLFDGDRFREIWKLSAGLHRGLVAPRFEAFAYQQRGVRAARAGKSEEAVEALEQAVTLDPTRANAWLELYTLYHRQGDLENAERAIFQAIQLRPSEFEDELPSLAHSYRSRGDDDKARALIEWAFSAHVQLAAWYEQNGAIEKAVEEYEKALAILPDNAKVRARLDALRAR